MPTSTTNHSGLVRRAAENTNNPGNGGRSFVGSDAKGLLSKVANLSIMVDGGVPQPGLASFRYWRLRQHVEMINGGQYGPARNNGHVQAINDLIANMNRRPGFFLFEALPGLLLLSMGLLFFERLVNLSEDSRLYGLATDYGWWAALLPFGLGGLAFLVAGCGMMAVGIQSARSLLGHSDFLPKVLLPQDREQGERAALSFAVNVAEQDGEEKKKAARVNNESGSHLC